MVRFDKKWFNPLYFILNDIIKIPTIRMVLVYGGKGSAKTVSIAQLLAKEGYVNNVSSIAFRKESATIQTTLKKSFNLALKTTRLYSAYNTLEFLYRCEKGSEIPLKGLDVEDKAKGVEGYKYIYLDELDHFEENEFDQFNISLRGILGQKIFASWNPVSENIWVKKNLLDGYEFVDTEWKLPCSSSFVKISTCGSVILIKTTYEDNYWIAGSPDGSYGYRDENLIKQYEDLKFKKPNSYRVNVLGEWGILRTGGEFWKQFDETKHVFPLKISPTTIHVSLDENVNPYVTVGCWQFISETKEINQVYEIPCKSPDNNAPKAALKLASWLNSIDYKDVIFVYGDPSASRRSTVDANSRSFYDKFIEVLRTAGFTVVSRVAKSAPEVALSAAFINDIYEHNIYGLSISISDTCRVSIDDYISAKEDKDGKMLKPKVKDKVTRVTYEPVGHFSDQKRYFITTLFKAEFEQYKSRSRKRSGSVAMPG